MRSTSAKVGIQNICKSIGRSGQVRREDAIPTESLALYYRLVSRRFSHHPPSHRIIMDSNEMFNWPNGDIILRATHGNDSRDFRVHKLFLSFASPVFKDMFKLPQPSSATSTVDIIDVTDPPGALEVILRFIYPSTDPPAINDLTLLTEVLVLADKYDIGVARSQLRRSLSEFARTEPLRVYAIACRLGFEDEMKIASSRTTSIHLPGLTELPDEFKLIPATEYHRLILLHARYRKEVEAIASNHPPGVPQAKGFMSAALAVSDVYTRPSIIVAIRNGAPLNYESLMLAVYPERNVFTETNGVGNFIRSILDKANTLNLTV
ncbi:hypothetical protein BDM02DRAFT_1281339 [Thelephora ganbajun]|uniref:Uncharacterized protein n=1 Tax=Thelephora ganbajun TaxID=370292 RepID=A0ACB6Z2D1_THEGA|nr:hypothetical protein BDM02DRAFT_1281339 [Thelephora ganbajun]